MTRHTPILTRGRYLLRQADDPGDIAAAQALRGRGFGIAGPDADSFDDTSTHILVQEVQTGALVCCFRLAILQSPSDLERSYCAQFHDLSSLLALEGGLVELGRFCIEPGRRDPDILRMAWAALTDFVDRTGARMLIGCSSFAGTDPDRYREAFALLAARHLAPDSWRPQNRGSEVVRFAEIYGHSPEEPRALVQMPPLLRSYLALGGRVGDSAVVDRVLNTLHVFTGLEVAAIPDCRKRLLRALLT
jgi:L-ornithine Nalpha-acyltransferase